MSPYSLYVLESVNIYCNKVVGFVGVGEKGQGVVGAPKFL
jgi:hypothetical protein